jgi:peptidoglycan/xylan/chitin deacetylase (PgdA/CDA1 family)
MHVRRTWIIASLLTVATAATAAGSVIVVLDRSATATPHASPVSTQLPTIDPTRGPTVLVNGTRVPAVAGDTVTALLRSAGLHPRPGYYLAAVSQRRLEPDGHRPRVRIDGRPATLDTLVRPGQQVTVRPGVDLVEPTETVRRRLSPPTPPALYVGDRPGIARLVRGSLSHERISQRLVRRPKPGHLVRPGAVALTFDDGPATMWTRRVLEVLRRHHHVRATFCMIGQQAAARPWLVREVVRAGHSLCDHTWDHDLDLKKRTDHRILRDIRWGARAVRRATHGIAPTFFRAPGGNWSPRIERDARQSGMTPLAWTVDPEDWTRPGVHRIVHTVLSELRPGGVILLHDGGGDRRQTIGALRILLHRLPKLGYHFVLPPDH